MRFIAFVLLFMSFSQPGLAESLSGAPKKAEIEKAENYLKSLNTARAGFIQQSHNGFQASGTFYLDRPGKLRFDYENDDFIVADGFLIYFYDAELQEQTHAPIGQTLADFLLRKDLALNDEIIVEDVFKNKDFSVLTLKQAEDEGAGSLELVFTNNPYQIVQWRVTDAQGLITNVELHNLRTGVELSDTLFVYRDPQKENRGYNE